MNLNNMASFLEVERIVCETPTSSPAYDTSPRSWMRFTTENTMPLLLYHCGQCLHHLRNLPSATRPLWWAAALYQVTMLLILAAWSNCTKPRMCYQSHLVPGAIPWQQSPLIALDTEYNVGNSEQDIDLQRFLTRSQGTAVLTWPDGSAMFINTATDVLGYCIGVLDKHLLSNSTELANSIAVKLQTLRSR
jgi:hypothetical protein